MKHLWFLSQSPFDWNALDGAGEYNDSLASKIRHRGGTAPTPGARDVLPGDWKGDPTERGRRLWLWWRIRVYELKDFLAFRIVLRLVALIQPSSASMERVFSQLQLILFTCGGNVLEETLESRCFERCNKNDFPLA